MLVQINNLLMTKKQSANVLQKSMLDGRFSEQPRLLSDKEELLIGYQWFVTIFDK